MLAGFCLLHEHKPCSLRHRRGFVGGHLPTAEFVHHPHAAVSVLQEHDPRMLCCKNKLIFKAWERNLNLKHTNCVNVSTYTISSGGTSSLFCDSWLCSTGWCYYTMRFESTAKVLAVQAHALQNFKVYWHLVPGFVSGMAAPKQEYLKGGKDCMCAGGSNRTLQLPFPQHLQSLDGSPSCRQWDCHQGMLPPSCGSCHTFLCGRLDSSAACCVWDSRSQEQFVGVVHSETPYYLSLHPASTLAVLPNLIVWLAC